MLLWRNVDQYCHAPVKSWWKSCWCLENAVLSQTMPGNSHYRRYPKSSRTLYTTWTCLVVPAKVLLPALVHIYSRRVHVYHRYRVSICVQQSRAMYSCSGLPGVKEGWRKTQINSINNGVGWTRKRWPEVHDTLQCCTADSLQLHLYNWLNHLQKENVKSEWNFGRLILVQQPEMGISHWRVSYCIWQWLR